MKVNDFLLATLLVLIVLSKSQMTVAYQLDVGTRVTSIEIHDTKISDPMSGDVNETTFIIQLNYEEWNGNSSTIDVYNGDCPRPQLSYTGVATYIPNLCSPSIKTESVKSGLYNHSLEGSFSFQSNSSAYTKLPVGNYSFVIGSAGEEYPLFMIVLENGTNITTISDRPASWISVPSTERNSLRFDFVPLFSCLAFIPVIKKNL